MKIETFKHKGVNQDGTFQDMPGAVQTKGSIVMSQDGGGCDIDGCKCSQGHWLTIVLPRTESGVVQGVTVKFDNYGEMALFLSMRQLVCN